jgi:hypothetical protein
MRHLVAETVIPMALFRSQKARVWMHVQALASEVDSLNLQL